VAVKKRSIEATPSLGGGKSFFQENEAAIDFLLFERHSSFFHVHHRSMIRHTALAFFKKKIKK
jgi:hypothetical protein